MFDSKKWHKNYYQEHKEKLKKWHKNYYQEHKEEFKKYNKKQQKENFENQKEWRKKNPEKVKKQRKKWLKTPKGKEYLKKRKNVVKKWLKTPKGKEYLRKKSKEYDKQYPEKKRARDRKYVRTTRKIKRVEQRKNPKYRLNDNIRSFLGTCLKGKKANRHWEDLVGYTIQDLIQRLEFQFDNKMNWSNYGSYWWVDHRKPISLFHFTSAEDKAFKDCWCLANLQPMEKIANIKKSNKF